MKSAWNVFWAWMLCNLREGGRAGAARWVGLVVFGYDGADDVAEFRVD